MENAEEEVVGFPVTRETPLIDVNTLEYPIYIKDLNDRLEYPTSFGPTVNSETLRHFGYAPVEHSVMPDKEVVTEGQPKLVDGTWQRTWITREYSEQEMADQLGRLKEDLLVAIEQLREQQFAIGFPYQFGDGQTYHVQIRDGDRANILAKRTRAKESLGEGDGSYTVDFQVYENVAVTLDAKEMVAMSNAADDQASHGYKAIWELKNAVKKAGTVAELPELPASIFVI